MAKIRTRARAVDMLGRQQIATIQNALSELFKNAHDAYAESVRVDYFEDAGPGDKGFVIVRDDGVGMTRDDFEDKWLVLGTESKVGTASAKHFIPPGAVQRPITGEKGIGRLAIALLGSQVLVLTRARREDGLHDLVACWLHWGLFEIPGLNLEDIDLPVNVFKGGTLPSKSQVADLKNRLIDSVEAIASLHPEANFKRILAEIKSFNPDPIYLNSFFEERDSNALSLSGAGSGTHFLIGPANHVIKLELRAEDREGDFSFRKQLLGFYDQIFGNRQTAPISTSFMRWLPGSPVGEEYLLPETFFMTEELLTSSDHFLTGTVDGFGQFKGSLRVYEKEYPDLVIPWPGSRGRMSGCGEFQMLFGYIQGHQKESILDPEKWGGINSKLNNLGGIYVYRDNIRILPYGDHSFDWLEVEKRRNKGSGYYFFSFRRMFGAVLLTKNKNPDLEEKAGREGFQANAAYRDLRDILMNLLVQLAAEFFRKGGTHTETFERDQAESKRRAKALENQQKRANERRKRFSLSLQTFSDRVNNKLPESQIASLRTQTRSRMEAASKITDQDKAAASLIRAEQDASSAIAALRKDYERKKPSGIALTKSLNDDWEAYLTEHSRLEKELFGPFEQEVGATLGEVARQARIYIDQRKRLDERIKSLASERRKQLEQASQMANESASETRRTVTSITEKARLALDETIRNIQADMNRTPIQDMHPEEVEALRSKWENQLTEIETRHRDGLMAARDMLASLAENLRGSDGEQPAEMMEALEERMLALEDQADQDFEMVQLGLAVAIINHEFAAAIRQVRRSVQDLGQISRRADGLRPIYESIKTSFEHLDGHLNLFTPLQRRLYRKAIPITGKSMRNYIRDLFANRFERHKVKLEWTESFLASQVECFPSTIYPALINIIDNAIFWVSSVRGERIIRLDAEAGVLVVANNGPEIEERDRKRIFERGFSRKPGGRGLGLFISARALAAEDMALSIEAPPVGLGASFHIRIPSLRLVP
ncbi:MAG: ATP-binding protein [Proteobacteria bacterium]|nr:ATP-binding protein [Pseudomonadota bacterium]MBU1717307.1 ATP-binding protein [Pseudomonadota bacterium]